MQKLQNKQKELIQLLAEHGVCTIEMATYYANQKGDKVTRQGMAKRLATLYSHPTKPLKKWAGTSKTLVVYGIKGSTLPEDFDRSKPKPDKWMHQFNQYKSR